MYFYHYKGQICMSAYEPKHHSVATVSFEIFHHALGLIKSFGSVNTFGLDESRYFHIPI